MFNLKPKENIFFEYFDSATENCYNAALLLDDLVNDFTNVQEKISKIEELEHEGDSISHQIITHLKKSFITPIDREDIYTITNELDSVVDMIQATAFRLDMYDVKIITDEAKDLSSKIVSATQKMSGLFESLKDLKNTDKLKQAVIDINTIEDEADNVFRKAVRDLFRSDLPDIEKMKQKEIYEFLEDVVDACEDVGDKVEEVVMKHA